MDEVRIPVPRCNTSGRKPTVILPLKEMEPGQSFTAPSRLFATCSQAVSTLTRFSDKAFTMRRISANHIRIWRIA